MSAPALKAPPRLSRVELYRLVSDDARLQILALCDEEELSVGELSTLLKESQPQMSRKLAPLRDAGLLKARRDGTRTWLKADLDGRDPVLADALQEGRRLCIEDGSLAKVPGIISAREETGQALFDEAAPQPEGPSDGGLTLAHLAALAPVLPGRALAIDLGTGEGQLLEVLAPLYGRVIAVDRSRARLARCAQRIADRGLQNVSLFPGSYDDTALLERVHQAGGADLVYAARTLHHAARPAAAVSASARLLKKGGHLVVLEYQPHPDDGLREAQGDVWLGLSARELTAAMIAAGLEVLAEIAIPRAYHPIGFDSHLDWHAVVARR
jgi:DNA-binding transcriptional ArsR family regulator/SAM-dependent methyltransferase